MENNVTLKAEESPGGFAPLWLDVPQHTIMNLTNKLTKIGYHEYPQRRGIPQRQRVCDIGNKSVTAFFDDDYVEKDTFAVGNEIDLEVREKKREHYVCTVCSILGLSDDVADLLSDGDDELMSHQSMEYWIQTYMAERGKSMGQDWGLKHQFEHLGFNEVIAEYLADILEDDPLSNHQSSNYWASLYINHLLQNHINLIEQIKLPTKQELPGGAISKGPNVSRDDEDSDIKKERPSEKNKRKIADLDLTDTTDPILEEYTSQAVSSDQDVEFWFHGTFDGAASSIEHDGIILSEGRGGDFSHTNGFYVTPNYEFAKSWAKRQSMMRPRTKPAIIVFKNNKDILLEYGGKEFSQVEDEWKNIVRWYRNGRNPRKAKISQERGKEFDRFQYIFGPLHNGGDTPVQSLDYFQLCLKNDDLAEKFHSLLEEILVST